MFETQEICRILRSPAFKERLDLICKNYSNLKQESHIRNAILELFNKDCPKEYRAFAEHPRNYGRRVDLSIINRNDLEHPFTVEFKYNFSRDANSFLDYYNTINDDFNRDVLNGIYRDSNKEFLKYGKNKEKPSNEWKPNLTSLFILIVAQWKTDKESVKPVFDDTWGIDSNLSRYVDNSNPAKWKDNIRTCFNVFKQEVGAYAYEVVEPMVVEVMDTEYHFFLLSRERFDSLTGIKEMN